MKDSKSYHTPMTSEQVVSALEELRGRRIVHREALQDVSDEMRRVCIRAAQLGVSDARIARACGASMTTVRIWLGKGSDS